MPAKEEIVLASGSKISWTKPPEFKHQKATGAVKQLPPSYLSDIHELIEYCSKITNLTFCLGAKHRNWKFKPDYDDGVDIMKRSILSECPLANIWNPACTYDIM